MSSIEEVRDDACLLKHIITVQIYYCCRFIPTSACARVFCSTSASLLHPSIHLSVHSHIRLNATDVISSFMWLFSVHTLSHPLRHFALLLLCAADLGSCVSYVMPLSNPSLAPARLLFATTCLFWWSVESSIQSSIRLPLLLTHLRLFRCVL